MSGRIYTSNNHPNLQVIITQTFVILQANLFVLCNGVVHPIYLGLWLISNLNEYQTNICRTLRWPFLLHSTYSRQTPSSEIYEGFYRDFWGSFLFVWFFWGFFLLEEEKGNLQGNDVRSGFFCCETLIKGL